MSSLTSNNVALTLLEPSPLVPLGGHRNAADAILDIVAAKALARKAVPLPTPREAGGSVSGEISKSQLSGMASGGKVAMMANREVGASMISQGAAFGDDGGDNALRYTAGLISVVQGASRAFHPPKPPTKEEWSALKIQVEAELTNRGIDPETIQKNIQRQFNDKNYKIRCEAIEIENRLNVAQLVYVPSTLMVIQGFLLGTFNAETNVTYDSKGEPKLQPFEFTYGYGRKIAYNEDGSVTLTRQDGGSRNFHYGIPGDGKLAPKDQAWYDGVDGNI